MIDIEDYVFTAAAKALRAAVPGVYVTGESVAAPPSFPCVCLMETDNAAYERTQDSGSLENHATVTYTADVYSNKSTGRKRECRELAACLDAALQGLGFTRLLLEPVPNAQDPGVYRITGRWRAVASKNKVIYRK